ncbi:MAG: MFS transporter [Jatrophihabitans sp.]
MTTTAVARRPLILLAVSLAAFMTYLDNNIVNVAIPAIQRSLHLSTSGLEWVVSSYILVFAGLLLAGGRLADAFGRRRLFLIGLGIFTVASLAAALAGSVEVLIAARSVQGVGAALVTPTTLAIISATWHEPRERATAVGLWSAVGALALAVGPLLGGFLSQHASWGWIFAINVPVGLATMVLAAWVLPRHEQSSVRQMDLPGLTSSAIALTTLTWGLIEGGSRGWTSASVLAAFVAFALAAATFVLVERRASDPMVNLDLFADRVFSGGMIALMMWAFGLFGIYFFTSLYLQNVLGFTPTRAGLAFLPMAACMVIGAVLSERIGHAIGTHRLVSASMILMGLGIATVSLLGRNASFFDLMPSFLVIGVGGGLTTPLTASVLAAMPADRAGVASGVFNASREVAGLLGITVIGAILTARQHSAAAAGQQPLDAFLSGYRLGLLVAAVLVILGGAAAWRALRATRAAEQPSRPTGSIEPVLV